MTKIFSAQQQMRHHHVSVVLSAWLVLGWFQCCFSIFAFTVSVAAAVVVVVIIIAVVIVVVSAVLNSVSIVLAVATGRIFGLIALAVAIWAGRTATTARATATTKAAATAVSVEATTATTATTATRATRATTARVAAKILSY